MAKDNRKINSGVQLLEAGMMTTYGDGQEDDLEAKLTPKQYARLKLKGVLLGDWKPKGKEGDNDPSKAKPGSVEHKAYVAGLEKRLRDLEQPQQSPRVPPSVFVSKPASDPVLTVAPPVVNHPSAMTTKDSNPQTGKQKVK